ncbi:MAG: U32 family peptidase C-terminal domain-containing protein [Parcubacteria group bacterium]|jgi:putative protease
MRKLELVAPGGSLEKIEYAYHFGADAAYVGHPNFSLRARINDFTEKKLEKAAGIARSRKKKIYFTLNIFAHERHLGILEKHLKFIAKIKPDALIISDPGIVSLAKKISPKIRIHLSTQANTTNSEAVRFWEKQGVKRIILAREVTLEEIKKIRKACPRIELEYFVHGAMCMSLSGRCLLSSWMRGRSANLGDCVQPCRWPYRVTKKEKDIIEIQEDEQGTYIFNSKDLCLIEHLDDLAKAGIDSFKIEGRTKSVYYVSTVVRNYRMVLDAIKNKKGLKELKKTVKSAKGELLKLNNRGYTTGFLFGKDKWENNFDLSHEKNRWQFVGEVMKPPNFAYGISVRSFGGAKFLEAEKEAFIRRACGRSFLRKGINNKENTRASLDSGESRACFAGFKQVKIHNVLSEKEKVEIVTPSGVISDRVEEIRKEDGEKVKSAHGGSKNVYFIRLKDYYPEKSLIRKVNSGK